MKVLSDARWIKAKGILFLLLAGISTAMLIADHPNIRFILLFSIAVWSFCRFYYFAFYVITNYVDPTYKFSGLGSFARYLLTRNNEHASANNTVLFLPTAPARRSTGEKKSAKNRKFKFLVFLTFLQFLTTLYFMSQSRTL